MMTPPGRLGGTPPRVLSTARLACLVLLVAGGHRAPAQNPLGTDPLVGSFESARLEATFSLEAGKYTGTLLFGSQSFPLQATRTGAQVSGTFEAQGHSFEFTATLTGDDLLLSSGGSDYSLKRKQAAPANPLTGPPSQPQAPQPPTTPSAVPQDLSALRDLGAVQQDPTRAWTILVYLAADNDLEPFGVSDLNELEAGLPAKGIEVLVLMDRAEGYDESAEDWTDTRLYRIRRDTDPNAIRSDLIARPGELDMGDPAVLEAFVGASLRTFPAPRSALILWDHGGGWSQMAHDLSTPGGNPLGDHLTLPEMRQGIEAGLRARGGGTFDIVGFDMCLMAQLETAVELSGLAEVMIASQAVEPGDGWPYERVLASFARNTLGSRGIAAEIVKAYGAFYQQRDDSGTTLSALDLSLLPAVTAALDAVTRKLEPTLAAQWQSYSRSLFFAESYSDRMEIKRGTTALSSVDLLDALQRMRMVAGEFTAEAEYRTLVDAVDQFILSRHASPLRRLSHGIAIYAPAAGRVFNPDYALTRMAQTTGWPRFLQSLHGAQQSSPPPKIHQIQVVDWKADRPIQEIVPLSTHGFQYVLEGENLLWLVARNGQRDEQNGGHLVYKKGLVLDADWSVREREGVADRLDLMIPQYGDGATRMITMEEGLQYAVFNGEQALLATIDESDLSGRSIQASAQLHLPEGTLGATIHFHPTWWYAIAVIAELQQEDGSMLYRQFEPSPETEFTLLFEFLGDDGSCSYLRGERMAWKSGFELVLTLEEPGERQVLFEAETIDGQVARGLAPYRIGEDPQLKSLLQQGGQFSAQDLVGTWDLLDAEALSQGTVQPSGLVQTFQLHPEQPTLLLSEWTTESRPDFRERQITFVDIRGVPHIRQFPVPAEGEEKDPFAPDVSVYVSLLQDLEGHRILTCRNTVSGLMYSWLLRPGSSGQNPLPGAQQPQPSAAGGLLGKWQSLDDPSYVLVIDQTRWAAYSYGALDDQGSYTLNSNVITSVSDGGEVNAYVYQVEGDSLAMQEGGVVFRFQRTR